MTIHRNNFSGQTVGSNVTVANSGDSGDAFTAVTPGDGTIKYAADPGGGNKAVITLTPTGGTSCFVRDESFNSLQISVSDCFYHAAAPTAGAIIHKIMAGETVVAFVVHTGSGNVKIKQADSTTLKTSSTTLTLGHWYRFQTQVFSDASAGSIACQWFEDDGDIQMESLTATGAATNGGTITAVDRGPDNPATAGYLPSWTYSNLQAQDGTLTPLGAFPEPTESPYGLLLRWGGEWVKVTTGA